MPSFNERLRLLRLNRGLTQEALGKIVGKSKKIIYHNMNAMLDRLMMILKKRAS